LLYARLAAGERTASADIAHEYLGPLTDWLSARNPRVEPHFCETAAGDAIVDLIEHPERYDPQRQSLRVYLRVAASGDLKNLLRRERRHTLRRADWEAVEHSPVVGKYLQDKATDPAVIVELAELLAARTAAEPALSDDVALTGDEAKVLELMRREERGSAAYAQALGITHLPADQQRAHVKRVKDRLKKRHQRSGRQRGNGRQDGSPD
jgi:RNA polymerase sigma-70 factor (ECF subfamily)